MGNRYILTVECPHCGKTNEDVYYAPTCGFTTFRCSCGWVIHLDEYTGISYEDASNRELIENLLDFQKGTIEFTFVEGDELPHRVVIDNRLHGAGQTKSDAVIAALSVGNVFPRELRGDKKAIADYLFRNHAVKPLWSELITVLEKGE